METLQEKLQKLPLIDFVDWPADEKRHSIKYIVLDVDGREIIRAGTLVDKHHLIVVATGFV